LDDRCFLVDLTEDHCSEPASQVAHRRALATSARRRAGQRFAPVATGTAGRQPAIPHHVLAGTGRLQAGLRIAPPLIPAGMRQRRGASGRARGPARPRRTVIDLNDNSIICAIGSATRRSPV
jgi:hypothetical protein